MCNNEFADDYTTVEDENIKYSFLLIFCYTLCTLKTICCLKCSLVMYYINYYINISFVLKSSCVSVELVTSIYILNLIYIVAKM